MTNPVIAEDVQDIAACPLPWDRLGGKVVLITGANGFLPAYLVRTLLFLNEVKSGPPIQVIGLVRDEWKAQARFAEYADRDDLRLIVQDVCQPAAIDGPVDYIVHAASQASPKYFGRDPVGTLSANVLGTRHLLELARRKRSQGFLYFSSAEVYGQLDPARIPSPESACGPVDPLDVRSCYAESKRMGETMCVCWAHQFGVNARIVRPFHTYGPGMALDDGRVFSDFVAAIVHERDIVLTSTGTAQRAYCYLGDATAGFIAVLLLGEKGQAYNVGNNRNEISVRQLAETLVDLFPEKHLKVVLEGPTEHRGYLPSQVSRVAPDTTKLEGLGWRPRYSIAEGFKRTIMSFLYEPDRTERSLRQPIPEQNGVHR